MQNFKETVLTYFVPDNSSIALEYVIFFSNVHADNSFVRNEINDVSFDNAESLKELILQGQPNFVEDNWYALEAYVDGFVVLHMLREEVE